ncbi:hypothetical protein FGB62_91g02 [Gracilaria domingensis]|nr:hypothetical protein FGB62_91g02 [Gracilaria domingensis]
MSFGDVSLTFPAADAQSAPAISELQRLLKPLAANNAALRDTTKALLDPQPQAPPDLKRVRALREQNRQIARAAASLVTAIDTRLAAASAQIVQNASTAKREFQFHLDEFSDALQQSIRAEKQYVESIQEAHAEERSRRQEENEAALQQEREALRIASETDPLLQSAQRTERERATLREQSAHQSLARETNHVLAEVQTAVDDVSSIFKDLAVMVGDQRSQVEYVEVAVSDSAVNVERAQRELEKTKKRHERDKRFFFAALITVALVIAVILILLLS